MIFRKDGKRHRVGGKTARSEDCCPCVEADPCWPCDGPAPTGADFTISGLSPTGACVAALGRYTKFFADLVDLNATSSLTIGVAAALALNFLFTYLASDCPPGDPESETSSLAVYLTCTAGVWTFELISETAYGDVTIWTATGNAADIDCLTGTLSLTGGSTSWVTSAGGSVDITFS